MADNRTGQSAEDIKSACETATEAAIDKAFGDYCGPREREDVTRSHFGLDGDESDTRAVLDAGLAPDADMVETRRWVHARANELMKTEGLSFSTATERAWGEADRKRDPLSGETGDNTAETSDGDGGDGDDVDEILGDDPLDGQADDGADVFEEAGDPDDILDDGV